ncbi:hypothetical protein Aab01nite_20640 [Paractinoplanes abujensis]|nr:hypothetical protein Aab01nite_20640 [Actinoplanes abujensis]
MRHDKVGAKGEQDEPESNGMSLRKDPADAGHSRSGVRGRSPAA